jgi:hypothetical protein
MRRRLLLAGTWLLGTAVALTISFAAVARVANGVAPANVAALSRRAIDNELTTAPTTSSSTVQERSRRALQPSTTTTPTTSIQPKVSAPTALNPPEQVTVPNAPSPTTTAITPATVTTSHGGTIWTRCTGPNSIQFLAAVPTNGYQRTADVEASTGIEEQFTNGSRVSTINAECSNGVVHAEVEDGSDS